MHFKLESDFEKLAAYIPAFYALCGNNAFEARTNNLKRDIELSPYLAKIAIDSHWLELCLSDIRQMPDSDSKRFLDDWSAVKFAAMCVEVHDRLSEPGAKELRGRLRDGLKSDSGFAPMYAEMDIASRLLTLGFELDFPDFEQRHSFDILAEKNGDECEIECKSFSVDAGRKVHRKDFYRLAYAASRYLQEDLPKDRVEAIVVKVKGRLSGHEALRHELVSAVGAQIAGPLDIIAKTDQFEISKHSLRVSLQDKNLYASLRDRFGQDIHAAGGGTEKQGRLLIVSSIKKDDTSKPILDHLRVAADQFSKNRPGFIAVHFNDLELGSNLPAHLLERVSILSNALTHHYGALHVAGVMVGSYCNAVGGGVDISAPRGVMITDLSSIQRLPPAIRDIIDLPKL